MRIFFCELSYLNTISCMRNVRTSAVFTKFKLPIILLSCILNIILLCDTCIYGTRFSSNQSVSQCEKFKRFTTLFWPVNRNLYFRGSCYSLSKTTHNGGKFAQTTELRSVIDLFGLVFVHVQAFPVKCDTNTEPEKVLLTL